MASAIGLWDINGLLARLQLAGSESVPGGSNGSSGGGGTGGGSSSSSYNDGRQLVEVVEVKNTCPFGHSRRWVGGGGHKACSFATSGSCTCRRCRRQIPAAAALMPQTQPHPTDLATWHGRSGKLRTSEFAVADRGPRQEVPPEWVPQLQLHMLCAGGWVGGCLLRRHWLPAGTGCCFPMYCPHPYSPTARLFAAGAPSGLLVSRSATRGTRVFRLCRDDELLRLMLLGECALCCFASALLSWASCCRMSADVAHARVGGWKRVGE